MTSSDHASDINRVHTPMPVQSALEATPPVGVTPPQVLAEEAAAGRRGAAWRLLHWIIQDDPRAVIAVSSLNDDRLAQNLLEFIALGTWAGKPFVVPVPLRTAHARTRLRTLFLPGAGMDYGRAERVLLANVHDKRPAMRETTLHILGIIGSPSATPLLIEGLNDPVPGVRLQAAKALGRVGDPAAVPALLKALRGADEQMGSQIFASLVKLGNMAVPALIEESKSKSAWIRRHCQRIQADLLLLSSINAGTAIFPSLTSEAKIWLPICSSAPRSALSNAGTAAGSPTRPSAFAACKRTPGTGSFNPSMSRGVAEGLPMMPRIWSVVSRIAGRLS